jgi:FlaA1/EpsC-like NDP-sugar epimerase
VSVEVRMEDLLGRAPIEIDSAPVRRELAGKAVLVTGAAGSIGGELCRQIRMHHPSALIGVDRSETGIFYLRDELEKTPQQPAPGSASTAHYLVADIGNTERMRAIFQRHRPEVVFHAAAHKHVPLMERNAGEAVGNNVFSLLTLLDVAEEYSCRGFTLISSDKAVDPVSVMGATKRLGEMILAGRQPGSLRCISVRFGNVLGTNGSVVPILEGQLRAGQALTITHPEVRRFLMTPQEAVAMVLLSYTLGSHGEILALDMGLPVPILELARKLIRLHGLSESEARIEFTGLREGEKMSEEISSEREVLLPTAHPKIKRIRSAPVSWPILAAQIERLRASMFSGDDPAIRARLQEIVPEYQSANSNRSASLLDARVRTTSSAS